MHQGSNKLLEHERMIVRVTTTLLAVAMVTLLCGCRSANRDPVTSRLNWSVSTDKAHSYTLGGKEVGDYTSLKKQIADLPRGSTILIGPYHEGNGYHFDKLDLRKHCERHGVRLGIPKAE